ncbi:MAG TPA: hypothetical protein VIG66_10515 [Noviherbaspirillum sp.]
MKKISRRLAITALCFASLGAEGKAPVRTFNTAQFTGLASESAQGYDDAALDYELDSKDGRAIRVKHCREVESITDDSVIESQFPLLRLLRINCAALKKFSESAPAERSFFPRPLVRSTVAAFPASATPYVSDNETVLRGTGTIGRHASKPKVRIIAPEVAKVIAKQDELHYVVLARADFDHDGTEDLLLRVQWSALDARGNGTDLFLLSRSSATAPVTLIWRLDTKNDNYSNAADTPSSR